MTYENVIVLRVCLETGLRVDDVLSLRFEQLKGRTIRGHAEKTGKAYRKVISDDLAKRLRGDGNRKEGFIFPHRTKAGEHRTRQAVWSNMKKAAEIMGVDLNAAPHSARKTYAVELFKDKGIDTAQRELQHDRLSTTMIYAFSNILTKSATNDTKTCINDVDIEDLAELIAKKVVEKMKNPA
jgi:integrase